MPMRKSLFCGNCVWVGRSIVLVILDQGSEFDKGTGNAKK
jgi:hypothetical protein